MRTVIIDNNFSNEQHETGLQQEIRKIAAFQSSLDEYATDNRYLPGEDDFGDGNDDWIRPGTELRLDRSVAVPVTDLMTARQYLWECCGWAARLNIDGKGKKVGVLPSGQAVFCNRFAPE